MLVKTDVINIASLLGDENTEFQNLIGTMKQISEFKNSNSKKKSKKSKQGDQTMEHLMDYEVKISPIIIKASFQSPQAISILSNFMNKHDKTLDIELCSLQDINIFLHNIKITNSKLNSINSADSSKGNLTPNALTGLIESFKNLFSSINSNYSGDFIKISNFHKNMFCVKFHREKRIIISPDVYKKLYFINQFLRIVSNDYQIYSHIGYIKIKNHSSIPIGKLFAKYFNVRIKGNEPDTYYLVFSNSNKSLLDTQILQNLLIECNSLMNSLSKL